MARSSLTYILGFSVKFFFQPIYKSSHGLWPGELKRGDEILKKSSPLKLLNQSQPNFAEM
jgi:hypothetical protein